MIKTYISNFIVVYFIYFTHKVHVDVFFPSPEKLTFGGRKGIFSHSFSHTRLKCTSFCREFNRTYNKKFQKNHFPSVSRNNNTKLQTIGQNRKILEL